MSKNKPTKEQQQQWGREDRLRELRGEGKDTQADELERRGEQRMGAVKQIATGRHRTDRPDYRASWHAWVQVLTHSGEVTRHADSYRGRHHRGLVSSTLRRFDTRRVAS